LAIEVIYFSASGELIDCDLEIAEVLANTSLDRGLYFRVIFRSLNNSSESWSTIADKSVNELMEVWVTNNSANLFGNTLHILQNLLELSDKITLGWFEGHTLSSKAYGSLDTVLLLIFLHLIEDGVSTFLVDHDLGLDNHIVDQSDESSQAVVISLSKFQDSVFELVFLLLEHH
jgi:hypothetical protein